MSRPPSPPASALSLRDFFGDRKLPEISRKITACVACRKLKIKCHMQDSKPPCTRCKKRGLSCTVNHSLQMLLESDVTWKRSIEQKLLRVEDTISKLTHRAGILNDTEAMQLPFAKSNAADDASLEPDIIAAGEGTPPQPGWEVVIDPKCNPAAIPASCISQVPSASALSQSTHYDHRSDLITRGSILLSTAEHFFKIYRQSLDQFVHGILIDQESLSRIRDSSALLTAAVCVVAALHAGHAEYATCYNEFIKEYASQMTASHHTLDDVRGLCIGAFWLSDMSWALSGAAVRIAVELNLHRGVTKSSHRCITKSVADRRLCYARTRLYLLVYVCDHHFSIAYGRSPMTREFTTLSTPRSFLELEHATEDDISLVAEVELWSIITRVFDTFGINTDAQVPLNLLPDFRRLWIALETWRTDCSERLNTDDCVETFAKFGVGLHFHFAKLYLCTHVFRGSPSSDAATLPHEIEEFADAAVYAARSLLRLVVANRELQSHLERLPTYFDTMIASSVVFLLKMAIKRPNNVTIDKAETSHLLGQVARVLTTVTSCMHSRHVLSHIAVSVSKLVGRFQDPGLQKTSYETEYPPANDQDKSQFGVQESGARDLSFLENYDLLCLQPDDLGVDWFEFEQFSENM